MTSEEQPTPSAAAAARAAAPDLPEVAPAGSPGERARALLRLRPYRRLWTAQLIGGTADRLGLLALLVLTVVAAVVGRQFGDLPRSVAFAVAAVFAARLAATVLFGAALLGPLHRLVTTKLDRRWTLLGADALRAVLIGLAPWWVVWLPATDTASATGGSASGAATYALLATVFVTGAAERIWTVTKGATAPALLPAANPYAPLAEQRPSAANLDTVRTLDLRTGWATVPLAAAALVVLTLLNNAGAALGSDWLRGHQSTLAALGSAALFVTAAALTYLQDLPAGPVTAAPRSPLQGLRAPTDAAPGPALGKGRTGSAPYFTFAVAAAYASLAGVASLALLTAAEHGAGPIGYGLIVLAATGAPALGIRLTRATLPALSRRRLLGLALLAEGVALILAGLVLDFVLVLLLTVLAALAAGVVVSAGRTLLAQEVEEVRLPKVTDHLYAVLRVVVAVALVAVPLIAAAYGDVVLGDAEPGGFTFIHGGAALAVATTGLLTLVLAAVVLLKTDDRRGTAPFGRDLLDAVRGTAGPAPHRASGTGFFIALEGGDGAGKSTQAQALAEWIRSKGHEVVLTREPGGSPVGQRLRALVLDVGNTGLSHRAEALIYAADRAEHVENVIRPALARGAVVITDRYMDSSIAYQGAGRDLAATEVARISRWATGGLLPDLTVVLDVDPNSARERFTEALDRLESEPTEFHQRVRSGFLSLAAADPARYLVVDGSQQAGFVTTAIRHRLDRELPLSDQERAARVEQQRLAREEAARRAAEEARQKAETEAAERKRLELLEQLRAEQAEKDRLAKEEAARVAAEAARKAAEVARVKAEQEARELAEEQARQRAAEEIRLAAEAAERERVAAEAAAQAELQRQRELQRAEQRRRAEEALQRAEEARLAEAAAVAAAAAAAASDVTAELPQVGVDETQEISERDRQAAVRAAAEAERTAEIERVAAEQAARNARPGRTVPAADETAVLPRVPAVDDDAEPVIAGEADRTTVLPRVGPGPAPAPDPTRELPVVEDQRAEEPKSAQRPRPSWAEETPMDDLPSLTDSLLGSREEWAQWDGSGPEEGEDGRGRGRKRRR